MVDLLPEKQLRFLQKESRSIIVDAYKYLIKNRNSLARATYIDKYDVKCLGDSSISSFLINKLLPYGYPVLSEESFSREMISDGIFWLIDPIDGSANFCRQLPYSYISISLISHDMRPMLGTVIDLNTQKVHSSIAAVYPPPFILDQSLCDNKTIGVSFVGTGFPLLFNDGDLQSYAVNLRKFRKVRMYGSAVGTLLSVARRKLDCYIETNIFPWDVAAVIPILLAEGCYCYVAEANSSEYGLNVIATTSKVLLHSVVNQFRVPTRSDLQIFF